MHFLAVMLVHFFVDICNLAVEQAARKWTMPIHNWGQALNRFAIQYEGRLPAGTQW